MSPEIVCDFCFQAWKIITIIIITSMQTIYDGSESLPTYVQKLGGSLKNLQKYGNLSYSFPNPKLAVQVVQNLHR